MGGLVFCGSDFSDAKTPSSFLIHIPKTGALCCVAAGPHGEKPVKTGRDNLLDLGEPHWRTNSSFSPPSSSIWDCQLQRDGLFNESAGASVHGTSASSSNKRSRRGLSSERYPNHQHSVSDGILSYSGFPPENVRSPQWTSPIRKFNFDNFTTPPRRGLRSETAWRPHPTERQNGACASVASCSYASPSSLTESRSWEWKQPSLLFPGRNFNSRRSFMSKPVYPLLIHNPVSDEAIIGDDACSVGRLTPGNDVISPSNWLGIHRNIEHNYHKILEPPKEGTTTEPSSNSRREDFRWSNASSYDMEFDGENLDVFENIYAEGQRSPTYHTIDQKCGVCTRLLRQKSPWGSNRIMRSGDLPVAGILPCSHVFHAECLEQVTPKPQIQDPPCPLCLKAKGLSEDSPAFSEPLAMALRSVRQRRGAIANDVQENTRIDEVLSYMRGGTMQISTSSKSPKRRSYSLVTNQFRKQFSLKGKKAKDFFSKKVFLRARSSSSSRETVDI